jgi:nucleotide-binding universal stress UspA family protein
MITSVLVPTDFSDEAHKALHYAGALGRRLGAHLNIVNVRLTSPYLAMEWINPCERTQA